MQTRLGIFCDKVIEAGWLAALLLTPAFFNVYSSRVFEPDKLTILRSIVAVMVTAWIVKTIETAPPGENWIARARAFARATPLSLPALAFGAVYLLTTLVSIAPDVSFWGSYQRLQGTLVNFCYLILFFLIVSHLRTRLQVERIVHVILATSLVVSLYGIAQHFRLDPLPWGGDVVSRVTSSLGNAIFLSAYLIMAVPLALAKLVGAWQRLLRSGRTSPGVVEALPAAYYTLVLCAQLIATYYTFSRGPWLGLLAGVFTFGILGTLRLIPNRQTARRLTIGLAAGLVLVSAFIIALNVDASPLAGLRERSKLFERLGTILETDRGTNRVRVLIWLGDEIGSGAVGLIIANPLRTLVGYGPETMYVAYNPFYPPDLAHFEARNASPDRSHNDLLDFVVTTGLLGLASFLAIVGTFFVAGVRYLWRAREAWQQWIALALLGAVAAHLVEAFFGIAIAATRTHFWAYLAVLMALWQWERRTRTEAAERNGSRSSEATESEAAPASSLSTPVLAATGAPSPASGSRRIKARPESLAARGGATRPRPAPAGSSRVAVARGGAAAAVSSATLTTGLWPLALYLVITVAAATVQLLAQLGQRVEPSLFVLGWYLWLLVGLVVATFWLHRSDVPRLAWRASNAWIYVPLVALALLATMYLLLAVITADIYFKKGQSYDALRRYDMSVTSYLDAIRWAPTQDFYYLFLGRAYLEMARTTPTPPAGATPTAPPRNVDELLRMGTRVVGNLGKEGLFQTALVTLTAARDLNPLNTDNTANLGRLHRFWGEQSSDPAKRQEHFDAAGRHYEQALKLSPHAAHLYDEWGLVYHLQGRYAEAVEKYQQALALDKAYVTTFVYLGDAMVAQNKLAEALPFYEQAVELDPNLVAAYTALGYLEHQRGRREEAVQRYRRAAELAPNDMITRRNLAVIYRELGQLPQALAEAEVALRLAPRDQQEPLRQFVEQLRQAVGR